MEIGDILIYEYDDSTCEYFKIIQVCPKMLVEKMLNPLTVDDLLEKD
jgi:hypothetical protein